MQLTLERGRRFRHSVTLTLMMLITIIWVRVNRRKLMPNVEMARAGDWELPTLDDLIKVYRICKLESLRAMILPALNCAFGPGEISSLMVSEIRPGNPRKIVRVRRKTGVKGQWELWPETAHLLAKVTARKKATDYVFTRPGTNQPLLHYMAHSRYSWLTRIWPWVCGRAGVKFQFKMLRKFAAQGIRDSKFGGKEARELMLSHACSDISSHYTRESPTRLFEALRDFRQTLEPFFAGIADCKTKRGYTKVTGMVTGTIS